MPERAVGAYARGTSSLDAARVNRDDEISLADLWLIVRRRWLYPVIGLLVGLSVAIGYVALATPLYESRASVRIGNVPGLDPGAGRLIEDPAVISVRLVEEYNGGLSERMRRVPYLKAEEIKTRNDILEFVAVAHSPQEARGFLAQVVSGLLDQHEGLYESAVGPLRRRLAALDSQIGLLKAQITELGDVLERLKELHPVQASLVAIERSHLYASLDQLERDRVILQQQTATPYINPSQMIARPQVADAPVSPNKATAGTIGVAAGLVLGLLVAFLIEFFAYLKAADPRPQTQVKSRL